jgi:uncharacterized tellurite resistance protein B-like protein
MIPFASSTSLNPAQIAVATEALLKVAHVDGEGTQEEIELIRAFYEAGPQDEALPPFQSLLERATGQRAMDPGMFPEAEQRDLVVSSCLMVGYADGILSAAEREAALDLARQLGVSDERFEQILTIVKDYLLAQLSGLPDAPSVAKVARELR